ncbi:MAG: hypothetical protein ACK5KN_17680 [Dysgonomonas sp.]|uniref:hypothetical protein n=1 Tax=Dysgonomonas sp. TaxID=1891233 RepID=UPI003A8B6FEE
MKRTLPHTPTKDGSKRSRYIETFILVLLLVIVLLVASHYDYEYQKEDRQAQIDCRIQDINR